MCVELVNEGLPCRPLSLYNCLGSPFQQPQGGRTESQMQTNHSEENKHCVWEPVTGPA